MLYRLARYSEGASGGVQSTSHCFWFRPMASRRKWVRELSMNLHARKRVRARGKEYIISASTSSPRLASAVHPHPDRLSRPCRSPAARRLALTYHLAVLPVGPVLSFAVGGEGESLTPERLHVGRALTAYRSAGDV